VLGAARSDTIKASVVMMSPLLAVAIVARVVAGQKAICAVVRARSWQGGNATAWPREDVADALSKAMASRGAPAAARRMIRKVVFGVDALRPDLRSIPKHGDPAPLIAAFRRARRERRRVRVAVVGGSVTKGHESCAPMSFDQERCSWVSLLEALRRRSPRAWARRSTCGTWRCRRRASTCNA